MYYEYKYSNINRKKEKKKERKEKKKNVQLSKQDNKRLSKQKKEEVKCVHARKHMYMFSRMRCNQKVDIESTWIQRKVRCSVYCIVQRQQKMTFNDKSLGGEVV